MFVPADKEWASYLIESIERETVKSRSKTSLNESALVKCSDFPSIPGARVWEKLPVLLS